MTWLSSIVKRLAVSIPYGQRPYGTFSSNCIIANFVNFFWMEDVRTFYAQN